MGTDGQYNQDNGDDIDYSGINEILKRAAAIRSQAISISNSSIDLKVISSCYVCKWCSKENSSFSAWCWNCGLKKNAMYGTKNFLNKQNATSKKPNVPPEQKMPPANHFHNEIPFENKPFNSIDKNMPKAEANSALSDGTAIRILDDNSNECSSSNGTICDTVIGEVNISLDLIASKNQILKAKVTQKELTTNSNQKCVPFFQKVRLKVENNKSVEEANISSEPFKSLSENNVIIYEKNNPIKSTSKTYIKPMSSCRPTSLSNLNKSPDTSGQVINFIQRNKLLTKNYPKNKSSSRPSSAREGNSRTSETHPPVRSQTTLHRMKASNTSSRPGSSLSQSPVYERLYKNQYSKPECRSTTPQSSPLLSQNYVIPMNTISLSRSELSITYNQKMKSVKPVTKCAATGTSDSYLLSNHGPFHKSLRENWVSKQDQTADWNGLPSELWYKVMSYLDTLSIYQMSLTCSNLNSIASDPSLWHSISVCNKTLNDSMLSDIGSKEPKSLSLKYCDGSVISAFGCRALFRKAGPTIRKIIVHCCQGEPLLRPMFLLHLSAWCTQLTHIHMSICTLSDPAVAQLAARAEKLISVCFPMCSGITDTGVLEVINKHSSTLRCLDLTGNTAVSDSSLSKLAECNKLERVHFSNCASLSTYTITALSAKLTSLRVFDIRGCKSVSPPSVLELFSKNPRIYGLYLANLPFIDDVFVERVATLLQNISLIDLSECHKVTNDGLKHLGRHPIQYIYLSATAVSYGGCITLGNYLTRSLLDVSFSFCLGINDECVKIILKKCKMLKRISLLGCRYVKYCKTYKDKFPHLKIDF